MIRRIVLFSGGALVLAGCFTTQSAIASASPNRGSSGVAAVRPAAAIPISHVEKKGNVVLVYIHIDTNKEKLQHLEGTAMLRTCAYLRREFPTLPSSFNLPSSLLESELDEDTGYYNYVTEFQLEDIDEFISNLDNE